MSTICHLVLENSVACKAALSVTFTTCFGLVRHHEALFCSFRFPMLSGSSTECLIAHKSRGSCRGSGSGEVAALNAQVRCMCNLFLNQWKTLTEIYQLACLQTAVAASPCSPTDLACSCTNMTLQGQVQLCVATSCTLRDALSTWSTTQHTSGRDLTFGSHEEHINHPLLPR